MRKLFVFIIACFCGYSVAENKKSKPDGIECMAIYAKDYFFVYFPVVVKKDRWEWYRVERTPARQEYAWIAEPGVFKNKMFIGNGIAFAASLGSANLNNVTPAEGSLNELLLQSKKNAYYTKKPLSDAELTAGLELAYRSSVRVKQTEDGAIMLYPSNDETIKLTKRKSPTHVKLKAVLPSDEESYECIVKIDYVDLKP